MRSRLARALTAVALLGGCGPTDPFYGSFAESLARTADSAVVVVQRRRLADAPASPATLDTAIVAIERQAAAFAALSPPDSAIGVSYERMRAGLDTVVVGVRTLRNYARTCARPDSSTMTQLSCGEPGGPARIRADIKAGLRTYLAARTTVREALSGRGVGLDKEP